ncbi:MAG: uncharacterized protein A8A55_1399 [Amphiamblys sp. WSBS2006]|nr:MAG: uncharacterized protein A8A55_1399 [Amphiamblys sp. WSBS2006]
MVFVEEVFSAKRAAVLEANVARDSLDGEAKTVCFIWKMLSQTCYVETSFKHVEIKNKYVFLYSKKRFFLLSATGLYFPSVPSVFSVRMFLAALGSLKHRGL